MSMKIVIKVDVHSDKDKQKALKAVSSLEGIDSISMDMKEMKMTVTGGVDPVALMEKLRKGWHAEIVTVGPKDADDKKKKEEEEKKKKEEAEKKRKEEAEKILKELAEKGYNPCLTTHYYVQSAEENPNACAIL